jgi:ABC-2 type transport system permease protein
MSVRRVLVLLVKELLMGPKNMIFIFALVVPLVITLLINLLVGTFFSGKPRLGVADAGESMLVEKARELDGLLLREYTSAELLKEAVSVGAVDVGLVLPAGFDQQLIQGQPVELSAYVWGESLLKDRAMLGTTIATQLREIAGQEAPVVINMETLGEGESLPWEKRLMPLVVMMTLVFGGSLIPATSLVEEKQKRTLSAVITTSTSLAEIFVSKGLLGMLIAIFMSLLILVINQALGSNPLLLIGLLLLGAIMAATYGVILGAFIKDINTLFAVNKATGILLYAPVFLYIFPGIPQWIGRIFPTYYMIAPVFEVSQRGAGWAQIQRDVIVLVLIILVLMGIVAYITQLARRKPEMLPGMAT